MKKLIVTTLLGIALSSAYSATSIETANVITASRCTVASYMIGNEDSANVNWIDKLLTELIELAPHAPLSSVENTAKELITISRNEFKDNEFTTVDYVRFYRKHCSNKTM